MIWSHDEQKNIPNFMAKNETITCKNCGKVVRKYVDSHYTGGQPCVLLAKYCRYCRESLN